MRRILALCLTALAFAVCGQSLFAQSIYTIRTVTPTSVASGSGDTVFVTSGPQGGGQTRYNICYYNGTTSAAIVPSAYNFTNASAVTYTFTVPGARFQTNGAAATPTIYATQGTAACTGTNPGYSNSFATSITATAYAIRAASPATLPATNSATSISLTGAFPTFPTNGSGLGLCFYNGASSTPLLPTSQTNTTSATFSIPGTSLANQGTARLYLASATSTCTGTNPGYGSIFSLPVTINITNADPGMIPAGNGDTTVTLSGSFGSSIDGYGICLYTGPNTTPPPIAPTSFTSSQIILTVPGDAFQIDPASFSNNVYNATVQFGSSDSRCTASAQGISNVVTVPVAYPTLTSASVTVLPQVNLNSNYTYTPTNLALIGTNFGSKFSGRFIPAGGSQFETTGLQTDQSYAIAQLLRPSANTATTSVYACNLSKGGVYKYCSTNPVSITNHALAPSTSQIASSPASPAPNQAAMLTATVTPGAGSTTAGGTFAPGPPTGTVAFSDNGTSLGTGTLSAGSLSFAPTGSQTINIYTGGRYTGDSAPLPPRAGESLASQAVSSAIPVPNEVPTPDVNSIFTSLTADFNQDGINDTLIIQPTSGIFHLFFGGSPLGTIKSEQTIFPGSYCASLSGVTVADLNGDGFPDITFLCFSSGGDAKVVTRINRGDGIFVANGSTYVNGSTSVSGQTFTIPNVYETQVAAADVNKDGKMDLVLTGPTNGSTESPAYGIQTYLGDGTGNFTPGPLTITADVPGAQIILKDLNNDGFPDLALLHYNATTGKTDVALYQNDGTGRFTALPSLPVCTCQLTNSKLFVTPFTTSSAYPDIAVDYAEASTLLAFLNKKTTAIGFTTVAPSLYSNLVDALFADFNQDGFADFAHYDGTNIIIELGNGTGFFTLNINAFTPYTVGTGTANAISLATTPDLNSDGYPDLTAIFPHASSNPTSSTLATYVTTGTAIATLPATLNSGSHTLTTTYTGNSGVLGSNGSLPLAIGSTTPTITWNPPATTTTTTPVSTFLNATATDPSTGAAVPGNFAYAYTPANASYLPAGTQTITANFTPTNTTAYSPASTTRNVTVNKVTPTITTTINPGNHTYQLNLATTYSAFVTGTNIVPTGTVQFNSSGSPTGTPAGLSPSGTNQSSTQIVFGSLPAGTFALTGTYQGDAVYNAITSSTTNYTVSKSTPTLTYAPAPTTITYGTGLVAGQLNATAVDPNTGASIPGSVTYSIPSNANLQIGSILPVGTNVVTATFAPSDNTDYNTSTRTGTITVTKTTPTVTYNPTPTSITYGTGLIANQLNAAAVDPASGAAVPGTFTYSTPGFTSLQNGSILSAGSDVITASFVPTDATNYGSASKTATITVATATTTTAVSVSPTSITPGQSVRIFVTVTPNPNGTAVTGLVNFTDDNGPGTQVTLSNGVGSVNYTPANSGTHNISAAYAGTVNYSPSSSTSPATFAVTKIIPTVTYNPTPVSIVYGTALIASQLNATAVDSTSGAAIPGTFSYATSTIPSLQPGTILPTGTNLVTATFTPTDSVTYPTASKTSTITVTQIPTTITVSATPLSVTGRQAVVLTATLASSPAGVITGQVTFTDADGLIPVPQATITNNIATLTYTTSITGLHHISVSYSGATNYAPSASTVPAIYTVTKTTPTITFTPAPTSIAYGTPLTAAQRTANAVDPGTSATVPGVFTYSTPSIPNLQLGAILPVGANVLTAAFTPTDTATYATATKTATVTVTQFTPVLAWTTPASIPFGTPLSSTQLNAVANDVNGTAIPGTYSYSPAAGTVLPIGNTTDTVTFTPTDTTNFATATTTRTITVTAAPTTSVLTLSANPITVGQSVTLTSTITSLTGIPTGTVTFFQTTQSAALVIGTSSVVNGVATISFTPPSAASYTLNANFTGTSSFSASSSQTILLVNSATTPTLVFAPNPATIPYGTPLSAAQLNATLTSSIPGAITYSSPLGTVLAVGANILTATFTPTDTVAYTTATKTATITVTPAFTTTTLVINPTSISSGQSATLTATVIATPATNTPVTGQISFTDDRGTIPAAQVALTNGAATLDYTPTTSGTHHITAVYIPTANYTASSTLTPGSLNVGQKTPILTYTPTPTTIPYGTGLVATQLTASAVDPTTAAAIPGLFTYATPTQTNLQPGTILPAGANIVTATFTPTDTTTYATLGQPATITVTAAPITPTLTLSITANNSSILTVTSGTPVTLTATLASTSTAPVYGQVNFCDTTAPTCTGTQIIGSAQLTSAETATLRLIPAIGAHTYRAVFTGTTNNFPATAAPSPLIVSGTYPTVTTFTTTGANGNFTLSAVVTGTGSPTDSPTGTVSFLDTSNANAPLATATLASPTLTQTFPAQSTPSGLTGSIILTADLNGDGIPDVITGTRTNPDSSDPTQIFSIFLGNGDATFTLKSPLAARGLQLLTGDFNHDGILDLAVLPSSTGTATTATILLGNGDGTFTQKSRIATPVAFGNALIADFNHDGILDLAIGSDVTTQTGGTTTYTGTIAFYRGAGDGTFAAARTTATPSAASASITADFNNDGIPDLLATGFFDQSASVLLGNSDGTFTRKATLPVPSGAIPATADLDSDGNLDLAILNFYDASVSTYLGKGDGTFTFKTTIQNPTTSADGSNAFNIAFADFNRDGKTDFAVTADDGVFLYTGSGDGTFTIATQVAPQTVDPFTGEDSSLAIADFNNDGLPDILTNVNTSTASTVVLARNSFASTATALATNVTPIGSGPHLTAAAFPGDTSFRSSTSSTINLPGLAYVPTLTWTPAPLTYGTPLSAAQLNAVARGVDGNILTGTFTYTPSAGTTLPVGRQPLSVTFTPADAINYTVAALSTTVQVTPLPTAITLASSRNPSAFSQSTTLTATIAPVGGSSTTALTGLVTFFDGTAAIGTAQTLNGTATLPIATLTAGTHFLTASYAGDTNYLPGTTTSPISQVVRIPAATILLTGPAATTRYGQPSTLTASVTPTGGLTTIPTGSVTFIDGTTLLATMQLFGGQATFSTTTLNAGPHTFSATYNGDATNAPATSTPLTQTIAKATPTLTFPTPTPVPVGTALSATQLGATATGVTGATLQGTFIYTPAVGAIVTSGPQTLTATFTPTDTTNYQAPTTITTTLNGTAVTLTALSTTTAALGDPARTITLTGTGFVTNSVARSNGVSLATAYVNPTTLTAILPATSFRAVTTLQITVNNLTQQQTTSALPFTVTAPPAAAKIIAPPAANPGDQPTIQSALTSAYPIDLTGTVTLAFTPISGGVVDPAIQFSTGGTTSSFTIAAGQTASPTLQIQSGTVAGTITVRLALTAAGTDVTPAGLAPVTINIPAVIPTITSVTLARSGRQLTVSTRGFSNTREVTRATFHFTAATGQQIQTPDTQIDVSSLFAGWYSQTASTPYGSAFLYTQVFTLDDDATVVGQVTVTLGNGVGVSATGSSQQ